MSDIENRAEAVPANKSKSKAHKLAAWSATLMWVVGFVLPFILPPHSRFVWVSDTLLLIGFWPLLYIWKPGWPWVVFGVLNCAVGFLLEISFFIPTDSFTHEMLVVRRHLMEQHSPLSWMIVGFLSAIFGVGRIVHTITRWTKSALDKNKT